MRKSKQNWKKLKNKNNNFNWKYYGQNSPKWEAQMWIILGRLEIHKGAGSVWNLNVESSFDPRCAAFDVACRRRVPFTYTRPKALNPRRRCRHRRRPVN